MVRYKQVKVLDDLFALMEYSPLSEIILELSKIQEQYPDKEVRLQYSVSNCCDSSTGIDQMWLQYTEEQTPEEYNLEIQKEIDKCSETVAAYTRYIQNITEHIDGLKLQVTS